MNRKLAAANKRLEEAHALILEAMAANYLQHPRDQFGGMELAKAADFTSNARRELNYAKTRNGYGQPR